ncbi:MAG: SAM-dependent chlorinase/fluorinase [Armatimonadetes bacterium]|nr:SAM-dependent chlorinase/fluorinase [Armatimonadota bacterium]
MSRIITLLTDFGHRDPFVGIMKGVILGITPDARIVDLCHEVHPQDISEASYILARSVQYFPTGSVHVAVVDPGVGGPRRSLLVSTRNRLFVAPDNGLVGLAVSGEEYRAYHLDRPLYWLKPTSRTFHGRDVFAPVAAHLARGVPPEELGTPIADFVRPAVEKPCRETASMRGKIQHIDRFGNLISNIPGNVLPELPGERFSAAICGQRISELKSCYAQAAPGELMMLIESFGYVEIACAGGRAQDVLNAQKGEEITLEWNP